MVMSGSAFTCAIRTSRWHPSLPDPLGPALPGGVHRTGGRIAGVNAHRRRRRDLELSRNFTARLARRNASYHPKTKIIRYGFSHRAPPTPHGIITES